MTNNILYVGNYTLDVFCSRVNEREGTLIVKGERGEVEIKAIGGSGRDKRDTIHDTRRLLEIVDQRQVRIGGGGINSLEEGLLLGEKARYLDMQTRNSQIEEYARARGISAHFFGKRDPPVNLVYRTNGERQLTRGPLSVNHSMNEEERQVVEEIVKSSSRVVVNSVKDRPLAYAILSAATKHKIPVGAIVTTSIEHEFARNRILPAVTPLFNWDELNYLFAEEPIDGEEDRFAYAAKRTSEIGEKYGKPAYTTLGKHGILFYEDGKIGHVRIDDREILATVDKRRLGAENGAGDHAGAALFHALAAGSSPLSAALFSQQRALAFLGYKRPIEPRHFDIRFFDPRDIPSIRR